MPVRAWPPPPPRAWGLGAQSGVASQMCQWWLLSILPPPPPVGVGGTKDVPEQNCRRNKCGPVDEASYNDHRWCATWLTRPSMRLATARALRWREDFQAFYDQPQQAAEAYLRHWC